MEPGFGRITPLRFCVLFVVVALTVTLLLTDPFQIANGASGASATYSQGVLHVSLPYRDAHPGKGRLTIEVLDPEEKVLARAQHSAEIADAHGSWREDIKLDHPMAVEDLVWHRVRYRFAYDEADHPSLEDTESISQILRTPVVHILGQQAYLSGGPAGVRVITTDSHNELIGGSGSVRIELLVPDQKPSQLYTGRLNRRGTTEAQFNFPANLVGNYQLHYVVDTAIGSTEFTQQVKLEEKASILLTTEKPIYQPGQTIHVRALALDRANHQASADRKFTFEVEDSRGNKVFKKATETDKFGVASAGFSLADEVNLGTYHLRALMGEPDSPTSTAELAINVERYVLPKFKVAVEFAESGKKSKRGYRPGDHVTGTVRANYFFGKPVDEAEISVKASAMDVSIFEVGPVKGKTDRDGAYHFDLTLPNYFAGRPLNHGAARVLVEATVKDSAGHSETRGEPITVTDSPLLVTAVPESGTLIPNLENQVFILTSYPDGTPARTDLKVHSDFTPFQHLSTDDGGVAEIRLNAHDRGESVEIEARDNDGNTVTSKVPLQVRAGEEQILLRTERAVYRAGDQIQLKVFSTKSRGTAYIDVVKDGQTILTRDVDFQDGRAELSFTATPQMAGTLDFDAYLFGADARPIADHRLVFVQPADELKIDTSSDQPDYRPGSEARIRFRVTDSHGEGVQAALGLQVVDEAVFALAEKQPGFAKVFFYLEQEVMKPRYEIHSIGMPDVVEPVEQSKVEQKDRAARALFSATEMVGANNFQTEFGRSIPMAKYAEYSTRYRDHFGSQAQLIAHKISEAYANSSDAGGVADVFTAIKKADKSTIRDSWGSDLTLERVNWWNDRNHYVLRSAGPDKQINTADDMLSFLEVRRSKIVGPASSGPSKLAINIESDRGSFGDHADVVGTVTDQWGGALQGASVQLLSKATGKWRSAASSAKGEFRLAAVPSGEYDVSVINRNGGERLSEHVTLRARDRANLTVQFNTNSQQTVVAVNQDAEKRVVVEVEGATQVFNAQLAGVPGGAMGGVMGGVVANLPLNGRNVNDVMMLKEEAAPVPAAAPQRAIDIGASSAVEIRDRKDNSEPSAHVRSYFPEALYINPEIVTDKDGRASIVIPIADSITTWRMAMLASTPKGALGSATSSIKVFQDFFVDLDLPVTLTQGDRVSLPVAVYNYSSSTGDVNLKLQPEEWFSLVDDVSEKNVTVESARVAGSQFTLEAKRIGKFKLTLSARMSGNYNRADIVVREIEVVPNGREQNIVFNGRLENEVQHDLNFPADAIPDASKIFVRLYPGPLSQVIEGMDSLLRMPFGCFEQTSSSTYPNVLALDYMKRTKKLTPEVHAKAEGYIANGYQRLLTFEVPGGGFSWFGSAPANKILTSYGLMEFYDMSQVHDVDPKLIARTQQWLASQQQSDGSWKPDTQFINEGATNRYNTDVVRITAYIAWALENSGYQGPSVENARHYLEKHMSGKLDTYTLAVLANFAVDGKDREFTRQTVEMLVDAHTEKGDQAWWSADETSVYATGESASVETTGLAVQALLKSGQYSAVSRKALTFIAGKKDAAGTWGTTQATIMALRALLLATEKGTADVRGTLEVLLNGKPMQKLTLTSENNDLLHQFVFKGIEPKAGNTVAIRFDGKGGLAYQVVGSYFLGWDKQPDNEPLSISVAYDRTHLAQDDIATATATIKNNMPKAANMVMVDLGIPPGFDLLSEDLQTYLEKTAGMKSGRLEKFSMTATQAILYFDSIAPSDTVTLHFRLRAKYPIRARTFQSKVYEYYDPDVQSVAAPAQFEVRKK